MLTITAIQWTLPRIYLHGKNSMILKYLSTVMAFAFALFPAVTIGSECEAPECQPDSSCSTCCQECDTCESEAAECSVCGGHEASDCCFATSIDVDSLKDDAQSKKLYDAQQARLIFKLPNDKYFVYLSGRQMSTPGKLRSFTIPVGNQERVFHYDVKVDMVHKGQKYHKKQTIKTLRAGSIIALTVAFAEPNEEEGLPADITFDLVTRASGGSPEDAGGDGNTDDAEE